MKNIPYEYNRDNEKRPCCWESDNDNCLPHFHSSIEVLYVTAGEVNATLNGQLYHLKANDLLIVPSYTIHNYTTEYSSHSYVITIPLDSVPSYKTVLYKKTFAQLLIKEPLHKEEIKHCLDAISKLPGNISNPGNPMSDRIFESSSANWEESNSNPTEEITTLMLENIVKGYTYVFLGLLIDQVGLMDINTKITSLTQEILVYLQENYLQPLNLDDLAEHFGYSKSRFSHIFNDYLGCSLVEYINGLRCRYAVELMEDKKTTITEIALASGYDSTRTFYRAFKKCFGCTPSQYLMK